VFGSFIALLFPFQLAAFWRARQQGKGTVQALFAAMLLLTGLALILASERSILLALAGSLTLWLLWWRFGHGLLMDKRYRRLLIAFLVFATGAATFVLFGAARWQALAAIDRLVGAGNVIDRAQLVSQTLDLIADFPLTGGGLASFPGLHGRYILGIPFFFLPNAHNFILDVSLEQGLFGILAFALLVAIAIWQLPALLVRGPQANAIMGRSLLAGAALSSLLVLLTHGMVEDTTYGGAALPLLFLTPALTAALLQDNSDTDRRHVWRWDKNTALVVGAAVLILLGITVTPSGRARWQANLAAVMLAQAELRDFPTDRWVESAPDRALQEAQRQFQASLLLDRTQRTARYRLGLIAMQHQDYVRAIDHLQVAYAQDPYHVGIRKALGYSYAWAGDLEDAGGLLASAPFISQELDAYITWWREHQRPDLAETAAQIRAHLQTNDYQTVNE
jgi:tetratricopeptide (TPR) repeat protein